MSQSSSSRDAHYRLSQLGRLRSALAAVRCVTHCVVRALASQPTAGARPLKTVTEDPEWATATSMTIRANARGAGGDTLGAVTARPHPTGWFISARHRPDASAQEIADFSHFVTVRVYLLLRYGPEAATWEPDPSSGQWRAELAAETPPQSPDISDPVSWSSLDEVTP